METVRLTSEELDALVERAESGNLQKGDADIIRAMANAVKVLSQAVNDKAVSIKKLVWPKGKDTFPDPGIPPGFEMADV